jgi:hypothetical protein
MKPSPRFGFHVLQHIPNERRQEGVRRGPVNGMSDGEVAYCGQRLSTRALQQVGSYLGYTGRDVEASGDGAPSRRCSAKRVLASIAD